MKMKYMLTGALAMVLGMGCLTSCEEKGLLVNANDVSYITFSNDMTKDTTTVSFAEYNEGETPRIPVKVNISGKVQDKDLLFSVSADEKRTTMPASLYELPQDCKIKQGQLKDTIYVTLKNDPMLKDSTVILALQVNEEGEVKQGSAAYARAILAVTDRLFKPSWWSVNDIGSEDNFHNSVEDYYLGIYLEDKYKMFLDELKKDNMVFDGKDKQVLRKYALRLKNTLKDINAQRPADDPLKDTKTGLVITVPVAG